MSTEQVTDTPASNPNDPVQVEWVYNPDQHGDGYRRHRFIPRLLNNEDWWKVKEMATDTPTPAPRVYTFTRHPTEAGHDCLSLGDHSGEYVSLADYQTLTAQLAEARADRDALSLLEALHTAGARHEIEKVIKQRDALVAQLTARPPAGVCPGCGLRDADRSEYTKFIGDDKERDTLAASLARVTEAAREWEKWLVYHGGMAALDDEGVYTKERCIEIFISMAESIRSAALAAPVDAGGRER